MAARGVRVQVLGLPELKRAFRTLPQRVGLEVLEPALRAGAAPIEAAIRARAPTGPGRRTRPGGTLKASVGTRLRIKRSHLVVLHVGAFAPHAGRVEFGHAVVRGGHVVGHVPAHPFARPAYHASRGVAEAAIRAAMGRGIEREAERVSRA